MKFGKNKDGKEKPNKSGKPKKIRRSLASHVDPYNRFRHWWLGGVSVTRSLFRVAAAKQTVAILIGLLVVGYVMAAFYTQSGEFVISLDRTMADDGFLISETTDFSEKLITLHGTAVANATNISIFDIDRDVMNVDGDHNGINYVAYTFYLKNATDKTRNYQYQLQLKAAHKGAEKASWITLYYNGTQNTYAMANQDGNPERQFSVTPFPFMDYASDKVIQTQLTKDNWGYITKEKLEEMELTSPEGVYQLEAIPFQASDMVCSGIREEIEPGEIDKYTAVIWMEGEDPECVNDIIGGYVELAMKFTY